MRRKEAMKRNPFASPPELLEVWLRDLRPTGPGISFELGLEAPPPARPRRAASRQTRATRLRRVSRRREGMS